MTKLPANHEFMYPLPTDEIEAVAASAAEYTFDRARSAAHIAADHAEDQDIPERIKDAIEAAAEAMESWLWDETHDLAYFYEPEEEDRWDTAEAMMTTIWSPSVRSTVPAALKTLFAKKHHALIDRLVDEYVREEEERPARMLAEARDAFEVTQERTP
jgi:hypothetical protein